MTDSVTGPAAAPVSPWWLYLVRMANGHLYCGVTTNVERRFREHCSGGPRCARALRGRGPLTLVFAQEIGPKVRALQLEWQLKRWPKARKEALLLGQEILPR